MPQLESSAQMRFLQITAIAGEYPSRLLNKLFSDGYKGNAIFLLRNQKFISLKLNDKVRGYRLTYAGRKFITANSPDAIDAMMVPSQQIKSDLAKRLRCHAMAATFLFLLESGVGIFEDQRYFLPRCQEAHARGEEFPLPAFYGGRELKASIENLKFKGSRSTGILLTDEILYILYYTGEIPLRWKPIAEQHTYTAIEQYICREILPSKYPLRKSRGLMIGDNYNLALQLMGVLPAGEKISFTLEGFEHFHYVPNDHNGKTVMRLLTDGVFRKNVHKHFSKMLAPRDDDLNIENDAMTKDGTPVLFCFDFDMARICRFKAGLRIYEKKGAIYCYDFQAAVIRKFFGEQVTVLPYATHRPPQSG